jgi:hypothetical protein
LLTPVNHTLKHSPVTTPLSWLNYIAVLFFIFLTNNILLYFLK